MTTTAGITVDDCDGSKPKPHVGVLGEQHRRKADLPSSSPAPTRMDGIPAVTTTATRSDSDTEGAASTASPAMSITRVEPFFGKQESVDEVLNNVKHLSVQSQEILTYLERLCSQASKNEDRIKADLAEEKKQQAVDEVLNNVKHLSVQSQEILTYLERLFSQASKVLEIKNEDRIKADLAEERKQHLIEDIASHLKDISSNCLKPDHLNTISCHVEKVLKIKIEDQDKSDLVEVRKQQLIEDVASHLKDLAKTSLKAADLKTISFQAKKDDATLLKCQTVLTDFVFFMLSLVPWLVCTHDEKSHPVGFYIRLFAVSVLAFLGMVGYLLSHIVRGAKWRQAVYCITIVSVLSTMGLVAFALFSLIPLDYGHYTAVSWIYLGAFVLVGIILLASWWCNYHKIPREDSDLNIPLV